MVPHPPSTQRRAPAARLPLVDQLRGVALIAMFSYHAAWFAADAGLVHLDFTAPAWRGYQALIAGTFLCLVGVSVDLAHRHHVSGRQFGLRTARIAGCAVIVTVTSAILDPARVVTFGILHCITVSSLLAWGLRRAGLWASLPGAILVLASGLDDAHFDSRWLSWTGLGTTHAPTFDFQPMAPWGGLVLLGLAGSACFLGGSRPPDPPLTGTRSSTTRSPVPVGSTLRGRAPVRARSTISVGVKRNFGAQAPAGLAWLGRHSLFAYMAHVPLLGGIMAAVRWILA